MMTVTLTLMTILMQVNSYPTPAPLQATPTPTPVPRQAPSAVVERFTREGTQVTRLSLFDSRVLVLSVRNGGESTFFRRMTLSDEQMNAFVRVVELNAPALVESERFVPNFSSLAGESEINLYWGSSAPIVLRYSSMVMLDAPLSQLVAVLNDLEKMVSEVGPYHEQLQTWQPEEGDLVELVTGRYAVVSFVDSAGIITLDHVNSPIVERLTIAAIPQIILRVVPEAEAP
jgi:hypothetical protein